MQKNIVTACALLVLSGGVCFFSCKKSSDSKPKKEFITASSWKFSKAGVDLDSNGTMDQVIPSIFFQSCDLDNTYTFKSDNTGTADEGASKCNTADAQTTPFTWSLLNNDTEINISTAIVAGIGGNAKILTANETSFILSKKGIPGYPQTVIVELVH